MSTNAAELGAAFENVLGRMLDARKKRVRVEGMALPLGVGGAVPSKLMVFPLGEPTSNDDRKWRFTKADLEAAVEAFKTRAEPLPILYDHGNDPSKGSKAAGWVDSVVLEADGLHANVHWTDQARAEIRSGEWGFRSPGWEGQEFEDGCIGAGPLNEISLVNLPAIAGMAPVVASSQPSTATRPTEKESGMATAQEAAKKAAAAPDRAAAIQVLRDGFPDMFGAGAPDDMIAEYFGDLLEGGVEDAPDTMMPGAGSKPETPAVPAFAAKAKTAEDEAKDKASGATAPEKTDATDEIKATLAAALERIKTLESQSLTGKIVTPSAADRKPGTPEVPSAPDPHDHVGRSILAFKQDTAPAHKAAIAYIEKARADGKRVTYREAVVAVTRKTA